MSVIKCGILGYGKMGKIREKVLKEHPNCEVIALYDPSQFEDPRRIDNPSHIFENPEVDAVFVCTPNRMNKDFTISGLKSGKHVFCEKPPAFTSDDIREIRKAEQKSGKKLMYGFNHRHHNSIMAMKEMIDSGEYGDILWMRGRYGKSVDQSFYENWRSKREECGGGILFDQGIHMLDLFLNFADDFDKVKAFISNLYWRMDIEDNAFAILKNSQTGVVASLHSTMTQWRHLFSLEIFLERGYLVLNGLKTSSNSYGDEVLTIAKNRTTAPAATWEDEERITFHANESWENEIKMFAEAILSNGTVPVGNSEDALKLMTLLENIYEDGKDFE
ncbi:MAG: Gfo/Idh/MocA family oxidoreductase [Halobacteriovoraceae bacterium]|nr:Gfo/Idh/MocA family oxidoreductase [Halobacteriovoraceae bacterium]